jgi:hypothetical protein
MLLCKPTYQLCEYVPLLSTMPIREPALADASCSSLLDDATSRSGCLHARNPARLPMCMYDRSINQSLHARTGYPFTFMCCNRGTYATNAKTFFGGFVISTTGIPSHTRDRMFGAILACGGETRPNLVASNTHLIARVHRQHVCASLTESHNID